VRLPGNAASVSFVCCGALFPGDGRIEISFMTPECSPEWHEVRARENATLVSVRAPLPLHESDVLSQPLGVTPQAQEKIQGQKLRGSASGENPYETATREKKKLDKQDTGV
jgi:hypothetical protein